MRSGSLIGAAAVALLATVASRFPDILQLDRDAVANGEVWRLWSGHLVHASRDHFVFDVGAACLLFVALGKPLASALRLACVAPIISLLLFSALPTLDVYYGLSGLLHAWAVLGAGQVWRRESGPRSYFAAAFGVGTITKAVWETWQQSAPFSDGLDMGGPVILASHLVGALTGLAVLVFSRRGGIAGCDRAGTGR